MPEARIVIIEDMDQVRTMVSEVLEASGFETHGAEDGLAGMRLVRELLPDLVVLDIGLPGGLSGTAVCQQIRSDPATCRVGIVALTGQEDERSEQAMFAAGADDYLRKTNFKPDALLNRVRAVLRRIRPTPAAAVTAGVLTMDPARREVRVAGHLVALTPTEFDLLHRLASNPHRAMVREELLDRGGAANVDRTVDVHVMSIRRKLKAHSWLVTTVYGVGYRLGTEPEEA